MDSNAIEKKRLANEKRLKAIQDWKKNRVQILPKLESKPVHKTYEIKDDAKNEFTLFNSDGEEDNFEDDFKIRPQFEGKRGQQMLEMNSELSSRFKLDERFKEAEDISETNVNEVNNEKTKNIKILESILGHEVIEKFPEDKNSVKRKRLMRFDPENERASKYLKTSEIPEEPVLKKIKGKKRKEKEIENEQQEIPVSTERYAEVVPNLKDLMNSSVSTPFSLSEKFGNVADYDTENSLTFSFSNKEVSQPNEKSSKDNLKTVIPPQHTNNIFENKRKYLFFISENDDLLKEGVEFFQRKNTLEQLQNDWNRKKYDVMELFRRKRKSFQRGSSIRIKASEKNKAFAKK